MTRYSTYKIRDNFNFAVYYDSDPQNPRTEWDNAATFAFCHGLGDKDAAIGNRDPLFDLADRVRDVLKEDCESKYLSSVAKKASWKELIFLERAIDSSSDTRIKAAIEKIALVVPVYIYEHSGIALSTKPFYDPFDSGLLGYAFMTKAKIRAEFGGGKWFYPDQAAGQFQPGSGILTKQRLVKARACIESEISVYASFVAGDVFCVSLEGDDGEALPAHGVEYVGGFYGKEGIVQATKDFLSKHHFAILVEKYPSVFGK